MKKPVFQIRWWGQRIFTAFFCLTVQVGFAQIFIDVTGSWSYSVPVSDITEAGNNFSGTYTSGASQVLIDVDKPRHSAAIFNWRVDVKKTDIDWNSALSLYARRTGDGVPADSNGSSSVSGGTSYLLITNSNQQFFTGIRGRLDIPIQYQMQNVSVLIPAKTYSTTIIYTVTEL
ncbi:MAG: hypothetical protein HY842_01150 [Bacteroidetes bacterium]|nr:hypothetical protein [Bacteroidota bacterium]